MRNVGKAPCLKEVRENCLKQLWDMEDDMATVVAVAVDSKRRRISECRVDFACLPDGASVYSRDMVHVVPRDFVRLLDTSRSVGLL